MTEFSIAELQQAKKDLQNIKKGLNWLNINYNQNSLDIAIATINSELYRTLTYLQSQIVTADDDQTEKEDAKNG